MSIAYSSQGSCTAKGVYVVNMHADRSLCIRKDGIAFSIASTNIQVLLPSLGKLLDPALDTHGFKGHTLAVKEEDADSLKSRSAGDRDKVCAKAPEYVEALRVPET